MRSTSRHACQLLLQSAALVHLPAGYNNTGRHWIARNSWGAGWAEGGTFRQVVACSICMFAAPRLLCVR